MMALFFWIGFSILFVIGLIYPEYRFYKLKNDLQKWSEKFEYKNYKRTNLMIYV